MVDGRSAHGGTTDDGIEGGATNDGTGSGVRNREEIDSDTLAALEAAIDRYESVQARIDDLGEDEVERGAEAYRRARKLLENNDERAVGTGREAFAAYVQFEAQFDALVDGLADDLTERAAFEAAYEAIDKRRLYDEDFEAAKAALDPAARYVTLLDDREAAESDLHEARKAAVDRLDELSDEVDRHEHLLELASVDLDAPVDRIRDPIETYNRAVEAAFADYLSTASAREVFALLERSRLYPLVDFDRPPADLREFVETNPAGESAIPRLLEYAEYSRSKLAHHVDDPDALKRQVATQRTYLQRLDAAPLSISWPPAPADELRFRVRERRPLVVRLAGGPIDVDVNPVAALRDVADLARDPEYDRLQTAATARTELTGRERERIEAGQVTADLEALRAERGALQDALETADAVG
ncbi:DUF7118 family protein [Halovivax cerinus]|uniref:Uncharacterized protein n=1 Tax=Halovivax cerinus TaxID=1487865 RepID=A0ABD5NRU8_9EURY|nr:hypothetical protein [Halovivax cerinus]